MKRAFVAIWLLLLVSPAVSASPPPDLDSFLSSLRSGTPSIQPAASKGGPGGGVTPFSYCNEGWVEWRGGGCCGAYLEWHIYECIGGYWQHVDTFCDSVTCY